LYSQGIPPNLDFSDIHSVIDVVTQCNDLPVHPRHPYAGELVFTAFSGSHQDAIKKGFEVQKKAHAEASAKGEPQYWNMPYLPVDPADLGTTYEAVIRVNSQSGKAGIAYLIKQHLQLDLPRKMQISFYQVIQAIADREAREMTVDDIATAFRSTYHLGGTIYKGRLDLKNYKLSRESHGDALIVSAHDAVNERGFDGTISVDGVLRVVRGDGNGPLSSILSALCTHLNINLSIREYSEHAMDGGQNAKAASFVELVPSANRKSPESWWGVGIDSDITGSALRAVISAVNSAIGDRVLPELKLSVGFNAMTGQADIASVIVNFLGLELPRRLQSSFFEVVQRKARDEGGDISVEVLTDLFKSTYRYEVRDAARFSMKSFKLEHVGEGSRLTGEFLFDSHARLINGEGNGPLSAMLNALHSQIEGTLTIRDYSEHSLGEGTGVLAASYVQLGYEVSGSQQSSVWGVTANTDITAAGLQAVLSAASRLDVVMKPVVNEK
jgi:2-isopropylmalate synthase